jgi:cell division protein FtsI (penicillin-binding protein 3)
VAPQRSDVIPSTLATQAPVRRAPSKEGDAVNDGSASAVPDFVGLSLREAVERARAMKVRVKMHGNGYVVKQTPAPGVRWSENDTLILNLQG